MPPNPIRTLIAPQCYIHMSWSSLPRCQSSEFDYPTFSLRLLLVAFFTGPNENAILSREILLSILALLDVPSMVAISQCSTGFRDLTKDPLLYATVDLRQVFVLPLKKCNHDDDEVVLLVACLRVTMAIITHDDDNDDNFT